MMTQAAELLALVQHHPGAVMGVGRRAARLLAALEAELPPDIFHATVERGKALELETAAAELLAKYQH